MGEPQGLRDCRLGTSVTQHCDNGVAPTLVDVVMKRDARFLLEQTEEVEFAVPGETCRFGQWDTTSGRVNDVAFDGLNHLMLKCAGPPGIECGTAFFYRVEKRGRQCLP